jgi:hypothetical protein
LSANRGVAVATKGTFRRGRDPDRNPLSSGGRRTFALVNVLRPWDLLKARTTPCRASLPQPSCAHLSGRTSADVLSANLRAAPCEDAVNRRPVEDEVASDMARLSDRVTAFTCRSTCVPMDK